MFQSILCPIDFSSHSRVALQHAAAIASRSGGRLIAVFAQDPLLAAAAAAADYDTKALARSSEQELREFVSRAVARAGVAAAKVSTQIIQGDPATAILRLARREGADLIAMGTQGLSGAGKLLFGSTTARVLRQASLPVLAVPPVTRRRATAWPGDRILAALDLGTHAVADARAAAAVASWFDADLVLAHVVQPMQAPQWLGPRLRGHDRTRLAQARARIERIAEGLGLDEPPSCRVVVGDAAEQIAAVATDAKTGLVVVTLRAVRGWIVGVPQGSTTYRVLGSASMPVLALPANWKGAR